MAITIPLFNAYASPTAPQNAVNGTLWYNLETNQFYIFNSGTWISLNSNIISTTTAPSSPYPGSVYISLTTTPPLINVYNGSTWEIAAANSIIISQTAPSSPYVGLLWFDEQNSQFSVWDGSQWALIVDQQTLLNSMSSLQTNVNNELTAYSNTMNTLYSNIQGLSQTMTNNAIVYAFFFGSSI